jgi:formiminotetrahydrofolate cyclodeaminase
VDSVDTYLNALASASPTPGGGSAATIVAAMGAALVAMAARITAANSKYEAVLVHAQRLEQKAEELRTSLARARKRDEDAFAMVMRTRGEERQVALREAAQAPLDAMELALQVQLLAIEALELKNPYLESDLACAQEFGGAAVAALSYNVRVNHRAMHDERIVAQQRTAMERCENESRALLTFFRERRRPD